MKAAVTTQWNKIEQTFDVPRLISETRGLEALGPSIAKMIRGEALWKILEEVA